MKKHRKKIKNLRWFLLPLFAVFTFFLTELAARNPVWIEKYYTQGIYPVIATFLSFLSNLFPFSLGDLFYGFLILLPVVLILFGFLKRISWKFALKLGLNILALVYISFYFLWGFNYYRSDLNQRLEISEQKPATENFIRVFENLVEQVNASRTDFESITKAEIDSLVEVSFEKWAPVLKLQYPLGRRRAKEITLSRFFAQAGISGYYGPFFNEVHINRHNLPLEYPFVLAHEKAHQFGITSEAEANFYAWVVCSQSESKHLQYSANLAILRYFLYQGNRLEELPQIIEKLDEGVKADFRKIREHWLELRNEKIDQAASKANDAYLKANKIEKGIQDYTGVVKHVMDFSADSVFMKKQAF
ncbi:DUF3810 domain-containing protein [Mariniphaga sp.]|uniref:DUF3810 domain-containing protein n=1 Tax=Mariniphaga sp. TaxID=1954475 RepID=UPI003562B725